MTEGPSAQTVAQADPNRAGCGTLFSILRDAAATSPEQAALVHDGQSLRYRDLYSAAETLACELKKAGVSAGDLVGLIAASTAAYMTMFFAVARIGAIAVPIPRGSKPSEVADLADQINLNVFCYSRKFASLIPDGPMEGAVELTPELADREALSIRRHGIGETLDAKREMLLKASVGMIRFSSGTTGKSKGIMLSTPAILARAKAFSFAYSLTKSSCMLHLLSAELATPTLLGCMLQAATVVLEDIHRLESIAQLIRMHGVTHIHASPLFYGMIVGSGAINADDLRGVRYVISTGAPLAVPVATAFSDKFAREIFQYYALAECGTVFANTSRDVAKRGTSGVLVPGSDVKLVNSTGSGVYEFGELLVKGSGLFEGYYRPWRLGNEVLEEGWFRTGDVARRDADGYYWIVGRTKDVINVGAVKVFPDEIEEVLLSHPAVGEAVVFGASDPRFGEVPRAKVVLDPGSTCTEKELIDFSNQRLSVFKRLRSIEIVLELPKTATGKLKRSV